RGRPRYPPCDPSPEAGDPRARCGRGAVGAGDPGRRSLDDLGSGDLERSAAVRAFHPGVDLNEGLAHRAQDVRAGWRHVGLGLPAHLTLHLAHVGGGRSAVETDVAGLCYAMVQVRAARIDLDL